MIRCWGTAFLAALIASPSYGAPAEAIRLIAAPKLASAPVALSMAPLDPKLSALSIRTILLSAAATATASPAATPVPTAQPPEFSVLAEGARLSSENAPNTTGSAHTASGVTARVSEIVRSWGPRVTEGTETRDQSGDKMQPALIKPSVFPNLIDGYALALTDLERGVQDKYSTRRLLDGGPIRVPTQYFFIRPHGPTFDRATKKHEAAVAKAKADLVRKYGAEHASRYSFDPLTDLSAPAIYRRETDGLSMEELIAKLLDPKSHTDWIWKGNRSSNGRAKVVFTTKDRTLRASFTDEESGKSQHIDFKKGDRAATSLLRTLLQKVSTTQGFYDAGALETLVDFVKPQGSAYETRHMLTGNLLTSEIVFNKDTIADGNYRPIHWFARIGASAVLSASAPEQEELPEAAMYNPLFREFNIPQRDHARFIQHTETLLREEMTYLLANLRRSGISANLEIYGSMDLGWTKPERKGGFPIPVITEIDMTLHTLEKGGPKSIVIEIPKK